MQNRCRNSIREREIMPNRRRDILIGVDSWQVYHATPSLDVDLCVIYVAIESLDVDSCELNATIFAEDVELC